MSIEKTAMLFYNTVLTHPKDKIILHNHETSLSVEDVISLMDHYHSVLDTIIFNNNERILSPGTPIILFMPRSLELVLLLACLFDKELSTVHIDPSTPHSLLKSILTTTQSPFIIAFENEIEQLFYLDVGLIGCFGKKLLTLQQPLSKTITEDKAIPSDTAWIVFSSGTTGHPKGIMISRNALIGSTFSRHSVLGYPHDHWIVACGIFFIWECLRPLLFGGSVFVISNEILYNPERLFEVLKRCPIDELLMTPSYFGMLVAWLDSHPLTLLPYVRHQRLKRILLNGEVCTIDLIRQWWKHVPETRFYYLYSSCEAHDVALLDVNAWENTNIGQTSLPLGTLLPHVEVTVDQQGELLIKRPFLASGYMNLPEKTASVFKDYYHTGDQAHRLQDGSITILGRLGREVRFHGRTVNLQVMEHIVLNTEGILQAKAVHLTDPEELIVYYVSKDSMDSTTILTTLRQNIIKELAFKEVVPQLIEVKHLPLSKTTGKSSSSKEIHSTNPLKTIFSKVIGIPENRIDDDANFWELGGNSLKAPQCITLINQHFFKNLSVKILYEYPTISALENIVKGTNQTDAEKLDKVYAKMMQEVETLNTTILVQNIEKPTYLLTGASGFLGSFVLEELLKQHTGHIICIVRGCKPLQKIMDAFETYERSEALQLMRLRLTSNTLTVLSGDLSKPMFGLHSSCYQRLADSVTHIIHCAASVVFGCTYEAAHQGNVQSSHELASFIQLSTRKRLIAISTNGIFPGKSEPTHWRETINLSECMQGLTEGYGQTKWVAESMWTLLEQKGYDVVIVRPGNIGGHSKTGALSLADFQGVLWKSVLSSKLYPSIKWTFESTPVDILSRLIVCLAQDDASKGIKMNAVLSPGINADAIWTYFAAVSNTPYKKVPLSSFYKALEDCSDSRVQALISQPDSFQPYLEDINTYETSNFKDALNKYRIELPSWTPHYAFIQAQWLEKHTH